MSDVVPEIYYGSLCLTDYPYSVGREDDGVDLGSPEKVMEVIETLLANGQITLSSGESNRTLTIPVVIEGVSLQEVAQAEAALQLECDRDYNEFTLVPGGLGATTIFDTFAANSPHKRDDRFEAALLRRWTLEIPAAPRPRSVESITTTAVPTSGTPASTVISDGTSTTGWSGGLVAVSSGSLRIESGALPSTAPLSISTTRTGLSIDLDAMPFLYVDVRASAAFAGPSVSVNGVPAAVATTTLSPLGPPWLRYYFKSSGLATSITVTGSFGTATSGLNRQMWFDNLTATNVSPKATPFQRSLMLPVGGAAPTEGSIHVSHATDALGDVIVYTCEPDNPAYAPNLRQFFVSGGTTHADSTLVSGYDNPLTTPWVTSIPAASLPVGSYVIWARLRSSGTGAKAITWSTQTLFGTDNVLAGSTASGSQTATFATASTWGLYPVGRVMLPGLLPDGTAATVKVSLSGPAGVDIDEAWLFNVTTGALTVISGTGLPGTTPPVARNLWIDTASIDIPRPTIWRGTSDDRSDSYGAGAYVQAWGRHELTPTQQYAFVVSTSAENVALSCEHFPRWPNYAAD